MVTKKKKTKKKTGKTRGRPPKYSDAELLQQKIDAYFNSCAHNNPEIETPDLPADFKPVTRDIHPTVSGLAVVLDLTRQGLIEYENKDDVKLSDTIKKAKQIIESYAEQRLIHGQNVTGVIFSLKNNYDWRDVKQIEADQTVNVKVEIVD